MGWYIAGGILILIFAYVVYGYFKIKNVKDVPPSKKILILNNKNFKTVTRKGTVLVDFWAPWCAPCKMVAPVLNEIAEENSERLKVAKLNVDNNQQLAQKYNVRNIPTLLIFKDGKEFNRVVGVKTKKHILSAVNE